MISSILVPTDLSARSDLAVRRAFRLAAQHGASIQLCHVIDDAAPLDLHDEIRKAAEKSLTQFTGSLDASVPCTIDVVEGDPTADIVARIENDKPDLVVMGTHRPRAFLDALRETTVQRIIRLTSRPVLLVTDRDDHDYDRIVAATDFSPGATAAIIKADAVSPNSVISPVHAFHVPYSGMLARDAQGGDAVARSFQAEAKQADTAWRSATTLPGACEETSFVRGNPYIALVDFTRASGATLIAAGAHGRVGQRRALLGSLASDPYPPAPLRHPDCAARVTGHSIA